MTNDDRLPPQPPDWQLRSLLRKLARQSQNPKPVRPEWKDHFIRTANRLSWVACHALAVVVLILAGAIVHVLLVYFGDPLIFDLVPWRYIFDLMDLALIVAVIVLGTQEAIRVFRE
jgi:hypothetical protein